ncbi:MAG: OmpA family protein [Marinibacterium sp.]|nr:OmpA family protein [Marinibacterium sp.]
MKRSVLRHTLTAICVIVGTTATAQTVEQSACALKVFFPNDVDAISATQRRHVADFVHGSKEDNIVVRGFASNVGNTDYNLDLSRRRSVTVGDVILDEGISYQPVGLGEAGPGAPARRVEIYRDDCAVAAWAPGGAIKPSSAGLAAFGVAALAMALGSNGGSDSQTATATR